MTRTPTRTATAIAVTRPADHPLRAAFPLLGALLLAFALSLLLSLSAGAAPHDNLDVDLEETDGIVIDEPTKTPVTESSVVAIPSVSPTPDLDGNNGPVGDVVGDLPTENEIVEFPGDLHYSVEVCDSPVPGQIDDRFCSPYVDGYEGQVYAGGPGTYEQYYFGPLPVDLLDMRHGPYLIAGEPAPLGMKVTLVCTIEDGLGNLVDTLTGQGGALNVTIGNDFVYRCTQYLLPEGELPTENAPIENGPVTVVVDDILCPAGTDPSLNFFGLIGRCGERQEGMRWGIYNAAGQEQDGTTDSFGQVVFQVDAGVWTVSALYSGNVPSVLYCNVRDENGQEPPHYAPFLTYSYGETGAVMNLEQHMTWMSVAYTIPADPGTGDDTADVSLTALVCPEGTTAPTAAACAQPFSGLTVHLLYAAETIVSTKQTDANGSASWLAPENLSVFGLAEAVPAGYVLASSATCVKNDVEATYPVIDGAIVDLGALTAADTVHCTLFNIATPEAPAANVELEELTAEDAPEAINEPVEGDISPIEEGSPEIEESVETEDVTEGATSESDTAADAESGLVPLEADE